MICVVVHIVGGQHTALLYTGTRIINRMRIALGLKPLNMEAPKTSSIPKEVQEARAKKAAEEEEARTKQVADKIATYGGA